ncbi:hypothetical protein UK82_28560 [Frankia sp. ACN1ag]|nr:hypothetical protein UK82_28560 [Frankia sp. ACN1ag]
MRRRTTVALELSNLAQDAEDTGQPRLARALDDAAAAVAAGRAHPDAALAEILPIVARTGIDPEDRY